MDGHFKIDWFKQLQDAVAVASAVTVHGNIKDFLLHATGGQLQFSNIRSFFEQFLHATGYELVGHYDILDGLEFWTEEQLAQYKELVRLSENTQRSGTKPYAYGEDEPGDTGHSPDQDNAAVYVMQSHSANTKDFFETFSRIRSLFNRRDCPPFAVVFYYSDYFLGSTKGLNLDDRANLILFEKIINIARRKPPQIVIIVADDIRKVPAQLYFGNPRCRQLYIPAPGKNERKYCIQKFLGMFYGNDTEKDLPAIESLAAYTEGLTNYDLNNIAQLSTRLQISLQKGRELVKQYKFGSKTSPWDELSKERIRATPWKRLKKNANGQPELDPSGRSQVEEVSLDMQSCLKERVVGQDHAIAAMEDMVIRAVQGIQSSRGQDAFAKPKGIFLFCGPTGVGKTELTKAFTEWLFGDESAMIRFDMSEFGQEHSDAKLIGAPPGYVGHEQGGQLTNAVKKKPFCVILFDEVDKMHRKIWDIFLQILDDGRLTDGTGDTVYFSESVIVMTSNLGGAKQPSAANMRDIRKHYFDSVSHFFREVLGRPEIFNRIGMNNVIVFNPIGPDFQETIIWQKLNTVNLAYLEKKNVRLDFDRSVIDYLRNSDEGFSRNGARGVENLITACIINPLAKHLFYNYDHSDPVALTVKISQPDMITTFEPLNHPYP